MPGSARPGLTGCGGPPCLAARERRLRRPGVRDHPRTDLVAPAGSGRVPVSVHVADALSRAARSGAVPRPLHWLAVGEAHLARRRRNRHVPLRSWRIDTSTDCTPLGVAAAVPRSTRRLPAFVRFGGRDRGGERRGCGRQWRRRAFRLGTEAVVGPAVPATMDREPRTTDEARGEEPCRPGGRRRSPADGRDRLSTPPRRRVRGDPPHRLRRGRGDAGPPAPNADRATPRASGARRAHGGCAGALHAGDHRSSGRVRRRRRRRAPRWRRSTDSCTPPPTPKVLSRLRCHRSARRRSRAPLRRSSSPTRDGRSARRRLATGGDGS